MSRSFVLVIVFLVLGSSLNPTRVSAQDSKADSGKKETGSQQEKKINDDPLAHVKKTGKPNGLIKETSPYLLMHAYNPVQWHPWNKETLALAKKENKPIFLSVGYSSCHWCHVMEKESFMDPEIAKFLNEHYICIKVDREERPDVDSIYMTSLSIFNTVSRNRGSTGWPLTMFLTPDAKPFFGGTYFPARDGERGAKVGFLTIVNRVNEVWKSKEERVRKDADFLTDLVQKELAGAKKKENFVIEKYIVDLAVSAYAEIYDAKWGGFGFNPNRPVTPKFPQPGNLRLLLEANSVWENKSANNMALTTLEKMYLGGMYDHVGGGFHRYSVDRYWRIPHFEKMLYDNGQLASVYAQAHALTDRPDFAEVARGVCEFVLQEMTDEKGGFYSALDADSEGEEGKFYVWSRAEIEKVVGKKDYQLIAPIYQLDQTPNFEGNTYAPQLKKRLGETALEKSTTRKELLADLQPVLGKLKKVRDQRHRPLTDTKVITSWNGLMIRGLADAGLHLKEPRYLEAAKKSAEFIQTSMKNDQGRLLRTYRKGKAKLNGYVDDYAFYIDGLIALHQATSDKKWLDLAIAEQKMQDKYYWDEEAGGYFFTSDDHESLLARAKNPTDGARPSGNGVSALNLIYLYEQTGDEAYLKKANATVKAFSSIIGSLPRLVPSLAIAVSRLVKINEKSSK